MTEERLAAARDFVNTLTKIASISPPTNDDDYTADKARFIIDSQRYMILCACEMMDELINATE